MAPGSVDRYCLLCGKFPGFEIIRQGRKQVTRTYMCHRQWRTGRDIGIQMGMHTHMHIDIRVQTRVQIANRQVCRPLSNLLYLKPLVLPFLHARTCRLVCASAPVFICQYSHPATCLCPYSWLCLPLCMWVRPCPYMWACPCQSALFFIFTNDLYLDVLASTDRDFCNHIIFQRLSNYIHHNQYA